MKEAERNNRERYNEIPGRWRLVADKPTLVVTALTEMWHSPASYKMLYGVSNAHLGLHRRSD